MGRAPCSSSEDKEGLKKGAWTAEEDEKLVSFIRKNKGHGSWRTLPKLAGLERCGKSCRLRWTNYLRPNIKRGNFSAEEERIIIQLHGFMGNKWSSIASHLPGRTDNEVKNHWNTHLKKRLTKMGIDPTTHLPLQITTPHNQDAANYYGLFNNSHFQNNNFDDWRMALLQRSLQLDPTTLARQLAQWELARLEAEARLQLAAASSHANLQHYASTWLQSLQQSQAPGNINVNDLLLQAALNLQLQATAFNASSAAFPNASAPLQPSQYHEANDDHEQLLTKQVADSWDSQDNQPIASCCKLEDLYGSASSRGAPPASEAEPFYTSTSGMATPETCSSESTSQLLCELPDLLSSTDELMPSLNMVPMSPPSFTEYQFDANILHDSYWNKMLNLLGHATSTGQDA